MHEAKSKRIPFEHSVMKFGLQNEIHREKPGITIFRCPGERQLRGIWGSILLSAKDEAMHGTDQTLVLLGLGQNSVDVFEVYSTYHVCAP